MPHRSFLIRVTIGLGALAGIALALPLWQTRTSYPNVPVFDFIPSFKKPVDSLFLLAFLAALAALVWRPGSRPTAMAFFSAAAFLAVQDQSRLQPWFVVDVLLLIGLVFSENAQQGLQNCRLVIAALYFWSGVHKMNGSFIGALFPWLVSPFSTSDLATPFHIVALLVPYLEMGIGVLLLFPRSRRTGVLASVGMHLLILVVLGPWALAWNSVVWPWNLTMLVLVPSLFWQSQVKARALLTPRGSWARAFLFILVVAAPPLSLAGLWDTYLAFDLYSGNPLIGSVILEPEAWARLDAKTQALAENTRGVYMLRIDDWSQAATNAPAYPAERVLRRVAQSLCKVHEKDNDLVFLMEKPARWLYRAGWHRTENARDLCQ